MTKEEKLIEFIRKTSYDACPICKYPEDMRRCEDAMPAFPCTKCKRECHCKACADGSGFELDEEKLDEWTKAQETE